MVKVERSPSDNQQTDNGAPHDTNEPLCENDLLDLPESERYAILFRGIVTSRVKPADVFEREERTDDDFRAYVYSLSDELAESEIFRFYLGGDLLPQKDDEKVYDSIRRLIRQHSETESDVTQNLHLEAYVRFRQQGHDINSYFDVINGLGDDALEEIFAGSPKEPGSINYNRGLVTTHLVTA